MPALPGTVTFRFRARGWRVSGRLEMKAMQSNDKSRQERLAALGVKSEISTPPGEPKMSAVILQLVEPLLKRHGKTPERAEAIISLAVAGWNKSMFPIEHQPAIETDLIDCFVP